MISVRCSLQTKEADPGVVDEGMTVLVLSHWNRPQLVVLEIGGSKWVVSASELIAAVKNATNTAKY